MQAGKNVMASAKETASNIAASAKCGMDKTKATLEEKVEKMTAQHPAEKAMAERKKQNKIQEAETVKQEAKEHNAAAREQACAGYAGGPVTTANPFAAASGHHTTVATGQVSDGPTSGHVTGRTVESHPTSTETRASRSAAAYNPYAGCGDLDGHGTGGGHT